MAKVLVVEDDKNLCRIINDLLEFEHFTVELVHDGKEGQDRLKLYQYDLVILDWELPFVSGVDLCRKYREQGGKCAVLMLTGKATIGEKESGFDAGADDYLTKPFDSRELMARIRALLRRPSAFQAEVHTLGNVSLNSTKHHLTVKGKQVNLLPKDFLLLEFLLRNPGHVFNQEALLNRVWSSESEASPMAIRSCIKRIRQQLADNGADVTITSIYGVGYKVELKPV